MSSRHFCLIWFWPFHLAIPALEVLHKVWSSCADRPKYAPFAPSLHVACEKIDNYYEKTTDCPVYVMAMGKWLSLLVSNLANSCQSSTQRRRWGTSRSNGLLNCTLMSRSAWRKWYVNNDWHTLLLLTYISQFKECWLAMRGEISSKQPTKPLKSKLSILLQELSNNEDNITTNAGPAVQDDLAWPRWRDFRCYLDIVEHVPQGWTKIAWWGVSVGHVAQKHADAML